MQSRFGDRNQEAALHVVLLWRTIAAAVTSSANRSLVLFYKSSTSLLGTGTVLLPWVKLVHPQSRGGSSPCAPSSMKGEMARSPPQMFAVTTVPPSGTANQGKTLVAEAPEPRLDLVSGKLGP